MMITAYVTRRFTSEIESAIHTSLLLNLRQRQEESTSKWFFEIKTMLG